MRAFQRALRPMTTTLWRGASTQPREIQISEAHAADELNPSNYELYCPAQGTAAQNCVPDIMRPAGVRTVDGSYNNLVAGRGGYGSSASSSSARR